MKETLDQLRAEAITCTRCQLCKSRTKVVFGGGPPDARVVFVAERPGFAEDRSGKPMVAENPTDVGTYFNEMLESVGCDRKDVYVTNAVMCLPPVLKGQKKSRPPRADEVRACRYWLNRIIYAIDPVLVVAMGGTAIETLTGQSFSAVHALSDILHGSIKGRVMDYVIPVGVLANPAYVQRDNDLLEGHLFHRQKYSMQELLRYADHLANLYHGDPIPIRNKARIDSPEYYVPRPEHLDFVELPEPDNEPQEE